MLRNNFLVTFLGVALAATAACGSDSKSSQSTAPVTSATEPTEPAEPVEATPAEATPTEPAVAEPQDPTYLQGKWFWYELSSTDPEKSKAFLAELLGWQIDTQDMGGVKFEMVKAGGKDVATITASENKKARSHWVPFVSVPDVDAAAKVVEEQKGKVVKPAQDIPNVGRYAAVADPNGAEFAVFKGAMGDQPDDPHARPTAGQFIWNEYLTRNKKQLQVALAFYPAVVGYTTSQMEMPDGKKKKPYDMLSFNNVPRAGVQLAKPLSLGGQWVPWVIVDDVDAAVATARKLKGRVVVKPIDLPAVGRTAIVADPTGAPIGLLKPPSPEDQKPADPAATPPAGAAPAGDPKGAGTGGQKK